MSYDFGSSIKCTVFGQSHSEAIGVIIEGFPAGIKPDFDAIDKFMQRRAPGKDPFSTKRKEADKVEVLSGLVDGITCGAPICGIIKNNDQHSKDYDQLKLVPRPGHADYTAFVKYGGHNDIRGGGQFSGRLTAPLCFAGALCIQLLEQKGIRIAARISQIANVKDDEISYSGTHSELFEISQKPFPTLCDKAGEQMKEVIESARKEGDSVGGIIECFVEGMPIGVGGPLSEGLDGEIAKAVFGIPAVKGVEFGLGFKSAEIRGSQNNDSYIIKDNKIVTETNNCGGILGGISNSMSIVFRCAIKPTPSISIPQRSVNLEKMAQEELIVQGRHDPCIVPRAVPVVEAVTAITIAGLL